MEDQVDWMDGKDIIAAFAALKNNAERTVMVEQLATQMGRLQAHVITEKSLCDDHLILLLRRLPSLFEMSRLMFDQNFIEEILSRSSHEQICDHVPVEEFLCAFLIEDSSEELLGMIWNVFLSNSRWDHLMSGLVERAKSEVVEGMSSGSNRLFVWLCCSQDKNDAVQMCLSVPAFWPMLSFWFRFSNNFTEEYAHSVAASLSKSLLEPTEDGRLDRENCGAFDGGKNVLLFLELSQRSLCGK